MTSKTKALKRGNYTPGNVTPAPVKKTEKKAANRNKEAESRNRERRIRSLMRQGISKEQINEWLKEEDTRFVLCLIYHNFCLVDGTKKITVRIKDKKHHIIGTEEHEVENRLTGIEAFKKFCENNKLTMISTHKGSVTAGWILSDRDNVNNVIELLKDVGRVSVTKPEIHTVETVKKQEEKKRKAEHKANDKPTNNTIKTKIAAKKARKTANIKAAEMRPYYAALRKGGVNARIKRHNPTLAEKIEKWLKEKKATEVSQTKDTKEERAKHRQLTSLEMKANKRARKAAKHLAAKERHIAAEKKRAESNAKQYAKRTQKAQKPVQAELKMAA